MKQWQPDEVKLLKKLYAATKDLDLIAKKFPGRKKAGIRTKLRALKIYVPRCTSAHLGGKRKADYRGHSGEYAERGNIFSASTEPMIITEAKLVWNGKLIYQGNCSYLDGKRLMLGEVIRLTNEKLKAEGKKQLGKHCLKV
jgi:hypothetical protein